MRSFLLARSTKYQIIIVISATILSSFLAASLFSLLFDAHQLANNIDLISTVYQVLGTIYAILLSFTLWGVWQSYCIAEASVATEANALIDLIHSFETSSNWNNLNIRHSALAYLKLVIEQEWPALKNMTNDLINLRERNHSSSMQITQAVQGLVPGDPREVAIFSHTLAMLDNWLDARRARLLSARGNSAKALWPLLLTGALVIFAFHGLFIAKTLGIWIALLLGTSLVIGLTFFLIFTLDCPFAGTPSIDSEPFDFAFNILT